MHNESNGTLRWFAVLGALTGMLLYKKIFSGFFVKWVSLGFQKVVGIMGKIVKILWKPFGVVGGVAQKTLQTARTKTVHRGGRVKYMLKKKLTFFLKVLKMDYK